MDAIVWHGGSDLRQEAVDDPVAGDGHVVLEIAMAGVCGSDLHAIRGHHGLRRPPLILGHELVGTVAGRPGRFAPNPLVTCGSCDACRRGEENLCATRGLLGLDRPGAFAERVVVAEDALVALPDGFDDRLAILIEPLATPLSALRSVLPAGAAGAGASGAVGAGGARVVVLGCGPIGLLAVHAAVALGHEVVAVEPLDARRRLAERLGAHAVHAELEAIAGAGADCAIDAVGIEATVRAGAGAVRRGGAVVVLGLASESGNLPIADLVRSGVAVRGHYAYTREDFAAGAQLLAAHPVPLDWLTVVPLADAADGVRRLLDEPEAVAKVLLQVS